MKKNQFLKSAFILMIGGAITKILGMVIRIITSRLIGKVGMGLFALISPTFMLLIAICQMGLSVAISKIVAEEKKRSKKIILGLIPITLVLNSILFALLFLTAPILSNYLLHDDRCTLAIISIGFVLPFISISSILRGYFFGKEKMVIHVLTNIFEDIVRIILLITLLPYFLKISMEATIAFLVLSNVASELTSIFIFMFFLPKNTTIKKEDFILDKETKNEIFKIGIPITSSRLIGNLGAFLEPIILTSILLFVGYKNEYIIAEYGIINGFVMPILLLPSFFSSAISQAMIPTISKYYSKRLYKACLNKIYQGIFLSLIIGIPVTLLFVITPEFFLNLLYNTTDGSLYIKVLAPLFLIQYIQAPMSAGMQAMGKAKMALIATIIGTSIKIMSLIVFSLLKIGMWPFVIATSLSVIATTIYEYIKINEILKK